MLEHRLVGGKDLVVPVRVAVELVGDGRQRIARLYAVEIGRQIAGHLVLDLRRALDVAQSRDDLLAILGIGPLARDFDLVALGLDIESPLRRKTTATEAACLVDEAADCVFDVVGEFVNDPVCPFRQPVDLKIGHEVRQHFEILR